MLWGASASLRGNERWNITIALHKEQERQLIQFARTAARDLPAALPMATTDDAANTLLKRNPAIDPVAAHWQAQRAMMQELGAGGRLGVAIGVAGAGKSAAPAPLVEARQADGRAVFGITLAWRPAGDLKSAGIAERASVAAFLKRVETGRYQLDRNSVVVVDEVGLVGTRQNARSYAPVGQNRHAARHGR